MKKYVDHLSGVRYPDQVPDTLDLTDRAKLALNGLLMTVDPEHRFEQYPFANPSSDPPWLFHYKNSVDLIGKSLESVAMMRIMSGDMSYSDIQDGILHYIFEDIGDDGLYYARALPERPWHEGGAYHNYQIWHQDFASVIGNARMMLALQAFMKICPDEQIAQALRRMAHGMSQIAIAKEDYAYYPDGGIGMAFCYPKTGWKDTTEPSSDEWGGEGTVMCYYGSALRAFAKLADEMHDEEAFETARRLANFCIKPKMWGTERVTYTRRDQKPMPIPGAPPIKLDNDPHHLTIAYEHAHFTGHFHGRLVGLRGILDYGMLTNDMAFKTFAQEGYEFAKHRGIPLTGSFGEHWWWGTTEGCTVADMTALAIRLTDAGLGDYWDDVDRYVRNQLIEQQYTDAHLLEAVSRADHSQDNPLIPQNKRFIENLSSPDQLTHDHVIDRIIGAYATFSEPTSLPHPYTIMCCTSNCTQALYYVWESMVREDGDTVHINLLLNRASRMADVYSWLPQQGKAVIRNKAARTITVRIPAYVQKSDVRWLLPNEDAQVIWLGQYLVFSGVRPGEKIQIDFPVQTEKYHYTMPFNGEYSITMKGNTCIDISPRDTRPSSYPIYLRDNLKNLEVGMTTKERFVTDQMVLHW